MASEDRLDQITQKIHAHLERKLASVVADIQAVREIAKLIEDTDADITRAELLKDHLSGRIDSASGPARDDLRRRIAAQDETISSLTTIRGDLTTTLAAVADELGG
jgi:hypothetical protein